MISGRINDEDEIGITIGRLLTADAKEIFDMRDDNAKVDIPYGAFRKFLRENVQAQRPATIEQGSTSEQTLSGQTSGSLPRLVRLFGFLFGCICWVVLPVALLAPVTRFLIGGGGGGSWLFWGIYFGLWLLCSLWWFVCFRWSPTRFATNTFSEPYPHRDGK